MIATTTNPGIVPIPPPPSPNLYLRGDGTWVEWEPEVVPVEEMHTMINYDE